MCAAWVLGVVQVNLPFLPFLVQSCNYSFNSVDICNNLILCSCAIFQAKRWQRGLGHKRINFLSDPSLVASSGGGSASTSSFGPNRLAKEVEASSFDDTAQQEDLTFVQKLEKKRAKRQQRMS